MVGTHLGAQSTCQYHLGEFLGVSIHVGTQKMMNYALVEQSQRKLWWRLVVMPMCMSIIKFVFRGKR